MSLSAGEQRTLSRIADQLAASDLKLASMFGVFNRLTCDEDMPAHQRTSGSQKREAGQGRLQRRTVKAVRPVLIAWLIISTLITAAMVLGVTSHESDGRWRCPQSWSATCTRP